MSEELNSVGSSHFIKRLIIQDLESARVSEVITRFPPEPNGFLHIGHAKSICLNFGLAKDHNGRCHLRLDDTNPEAEKSEYTLAIQDIVKWLGFDYGAHCYYASDYFEKYYDYAVLLIKNQLAYVDSQDKESVRHGRGTLTQAGINSPYRERSVSENLDLFSRMRAGEFIESEHVVRLKIDMSHPNMNMRDPMIYRIRYAKHHRTGDHWCIYPLYDYAHCIADALEGITHSLCTLEFEDHRPLYEWILNHLKKLGVLDHISYLPQQTEFSRLNITYSVTSKRKLKKLVESGALMGWDDPRLSTLIGLRRRGFTPKSLQVFCEKIGITKSDSWVQWSYLEECLRQDLNESAPRAFAILKPLKLVITNYPDEQTEICHAPLHPKNDWGVRKVLLSKNIWIDQDDFMQEPSKGFFRLVPGGMVRLRYAYVIVCDEVVFDESGQLSHLCCRYFPDTKSGTPGADSIKVKGNIHWLSQISAQPSVFRLFSSLFLSEKPDQSEKDFMELVNPESLHEVQGYVEPNLALSLACDRLQFERVGYFVKDIDSSDQVAVFNRAVTLKDGWKNS